MNLDKINKKRCVQKVYNIKYTKSIQYRKALGGAIGSILFVYIFIQKWKYTFCIHSVYILYIFRSIISIEDSHG